MARIFDVLTDNLSGADQEVSYKEKQLIEPKNHRSLAEYCTFHTPLGTALSPAALSQSSAQADLIAIAPTKQTAHLASRLLSSKLTLSTFVSQPFQYSYWLLMGLFLTACSNLGGSGGGGLPADPADIDPPIGEIDIEFTGDALTFSKEFNDDYLDEVENQSDGEPAPQEAANQELFIKFSADQEIDFEAKLEYEVTLTNPLDVDETLRYSHAQAIATEGEAFPFFALTETDGSGYLLANHRYDFDSDRDEFYTIKLIARTEGGQIYDSIDIKIRGLDIADEAPVFISPNEIIVNEDYGDGSSDVSKEANFIHQFRAFADKDTTDITSYELVNDANDNEFDNGLFELDSSSGKLTLKSNAVLDHEQGDTRIVVVEADDGEKTATQTLTITLTDLHDTGPDFTLSDFNISADLTVNDALLDTPLSATPDVAGATISFAISGNDANNFRIDNGNNLYLTDAGVAALATASSFTITVTAVSELNGVSRSTDQMITIFAVAHTFDTPQQIETSFAEGELTADLELVSFTLNGRYNESNDSFELLDDNDNVVNDSRFNVRIATDSNANTTTFTLYALADSEFDLGDDSATIQSKLRVTVNDETVTSELVAFTITPDGDNSFTATDEEEIFNGRSGTDTLSYVDSDEAVTVELDGDKDANGFITGSGGYAAGDLIKNIENIIGSDRDDRIEGDDADNVIDGGAGNDRFTGGGGDDVFVAHILAGDTDIITDFLSGDKIRVDVDDASSITDLASLMTALSLTITNDSDHGTDGNNDTILTFAGQNGANDYLLVLEGFTTDLTYTDFEVI